MGARVLNWGQTNKPYEIVSLKIHAKDLFAQQTKEQEETCSYSA